MSNLDLISWILRGKQRRKVILALSSRKTPTLVKEETKLALNNVSDVLRDFVKQGVAICLNPNSKTGRMYQLTEKGERIRRELGASAKN